jgi:hypothetical protein
MIDAEAAGHAEMHDQNLAVIEPGEQILGAPVQRLNLPPFEPLREMVRKREAQVFPPLLDIGEAIADKDWHQALPHCLDFREFRHRTAYRNAKGFIAVQQ